MDVIDSFIGLGATTLFLLAGLCFLIGWKYFKMGFAGQTLSIFKFATIIFAVGGLVASGVLLTPSETVAPATAVEWDVTASETMSHVISIGTNYYKVQLSFNDTSNAFVSATNFCVLNFTVDRIDTATDFAFTTAEVSSIGDYTSTTTGFTYDIIAKGTDGLYEADWTKSNLGIKNMESSLPIDRDTRSDWVAINFTASATCVAQMAQYHSVISTVVVGGETFTIDWEKTAVVT